MPHDSNESNDDVGAVTRPVGDQLQWLALQRLADHDDAARCYLRIDTPLRYTPVVPSDNPALRTTDTDRDIPLDVLHNATQADHTMDGNRILHVADFRVHVPWPGRVGDHADSHRVDEAGRIEDYAAIHLHVEEHTTPRTDDQ